MLSNYRSYAQRRKPFQSPPVSSNVINEGVGTTVKVFQAGSIRAPSAGMADETITDFKPITSYSYIKSIQPTILVPGCPTLYKGFKAPLTVEPDTGMELVDKASSLLPEGPLLPLFEAIRFVEPEHDFGQYEITTGRGSLKKLLSWVLGDLNKELRIDLEVTDTKGLILRRWESAYFCSAGKDIGTQGRAIHYRTNFEKSTCFPVNGNEDAFSHERAVSYNLDGLRCLVQREVDGFALDGEFEGIASGICAEVPKESVSDLVEELSKMALKSSHKKAPSDLSAPLLVLPYHGFEIGHENLIELKTRSMRNPHPIKESEIYAQAVWSGTPVTINALHESGVFKREKIYELLELEKMKETEQVREGVKKVGVLLKEIINILKDKPAGSKYCLICKGRGTDLFLKEGGRGAGMTKM